MKPLLFFLLISLNLVGQGDAKKVDAKFGFRDIKLEIPFSEFSTKGVIKSTEGGDIKYYKLKNENLSLGDYKLESVKYIFYKDKLSQILIETRGFVNSNGLLEVLKTQYGEGYKGNKYIEKYLWSGQKAGIYYNQNSADKSAVVIIYSKSLQEQEKRDTDEKNKKAADDGF